MNKQDIIVPHNEKRLNEILSVIIGDYHNVFVENGTLIVEDEFIDTGCKNDDDCSDLARENGEELIEKYPELEISDYCCHRHKYSIVELKLKGHVQGDS